MTIYTKTSAGLEAIKNPNIALPRRLRSLLICIDGRSSLQTYVRSLPTFGDVEALMDSLLAAGLIEVLGQARQEPSTVAPANLLGEPAPPRANEHQAANVNVARPLSLRQAVDAMGDFIKQHLPDDAIEILLMLDKVDSLEELGALLPSYLELIQPIGGRAALHVRQLESLTQRTLL